MKRTKIVCSLGPSITGPDVLKKLIANGMNVARHNFSHGDHEEHKGRMDMVKAVREELNVPIAILLDTKGPEIRTGDFEGGSATLVEGTSFVLKYDTVMGNENFCSVSYKGLWQDVKPGDHILICDGLVELEVENVVEKDIHCKILNTGTLGNRKNMNVPGVDVNLPAMTERDHADIIFGVTQDIDFVAASFVRKAQDVIDIRKLLDDNGGKEVKIIAKIENRQGLNNLDEILALADGIMVARGDLGSEIPMAEVPIAQKLMIEKCFRAGKPVITATQMLDSMIRNPRPTRAEASDVANAIFDGTSAIMLSGETANGKYPDIAVKTMSEIAQMAEDAIDYWSRFDSMNYDAHNDVTTAICRATCTTARDLDAAAIVTVTESGKTAREISRFRPDCTIIATSSNAKVMRQLNLSWGVEPFLVGKASSTDELFKSGVEVAVNSGLVKENERVVITAGVPVGVSGSTNLIKVHTIGEDNLVED